TGASWSVATTRRSTPRTAVTATSTIASTGWRRTCSWRLARATPCPTASRPGVHAAPPSRATCSTRCAAGARRGRQHTQDERPPRCEYRDGRRVRPGSGPDRLEAEVVRDLHHEHVVRGRVAHHVHAVVHVELRRGVAVRALLRPHEVHR